jgi:transcriptional accessory protein Tex/SPT6
MPNLDLWINQQNSNEDTTTTISNFENCLLSIRDQYQKIRLNSDHPISNERYEKIIEMIDTLEKYKEAVTNENNNQQQQHQQQNEYEEEEKELLIIINNIFNELDKKRKIAINKNDKDLLRDQIESYRMEEITLDYILYIILEFTGKLI